MKVLIVVATLIALSSAATAQQKQETPSLTDVTGVWIMLVEGHQISLELEQKGTTVDGVMHAMGTRQLLKGTYVERALTLVGEKMEGAPDGPHGNPHAGPIEARMLDNGTLEGELSTNRGRRKWTGERLQKR